MTTPRGLNEPSVGFWLDCTGATYLEACGSGSQMASHSNPTHASISEASGAPDSMQRRSRPGLAALFALAVANGVFLHFLPARAEPEYAWPIAPAVNAAFTGAG